MDAIEKFMRRVVGKERAFINSAISRLIRREIVGMDIRKLKGNGDFFRVRSGDFRIIYTERNGKIIIIMVDRRSEDTYKK